MKNIEFKKSKNPFQEQLKEEKKFINNQKKVFVAADKTTNFYIVEPKDYQNIVNKNVEKEYKKETKSNIKKINKAHKSIVKKLDLADRVFQTNQICSYDSYYKLCRTIFFETIFF